MAARPVEDAPPISATAQQAGLLGKSALALNCSLHSLPCTLHSRAQALGVWAYGKVKKPHI